MQEVVVLVVGGWRSRPLVVLRRRAPWIANVLLPPGRPSRILVVGALVDSFGSGLFMATATLYFVGIAKFPAAQVAGVLSVAAFFGLLSPVPLGRAADRFGAVGTYVTLMLFRGVGYAGYVLVHSLPAYAILTCAIYMVDRACSPLLQVIVSNIVGEAERTRSLASIRAVRNIGLTGGLLLAGLVLALNSTAAFNIVFVINGLSYGVIAAMVLYAERLSPHPRSVKAEGKVLTSSVTSPLRNPRFMAFTFANGILMLYDSMISVLLPIWVVQRTNLPIALLSVLLVVNTVLTIAMQLAAAHFVSTVRSSLRMVRGAAFAMIVACGLFALAEQMPIWISAVAAIGAVLALTVAENIHQVASWELSYVMSPAAARARYLGAFSMGLTTQKIVGPVLLVSVLLPLKSWAWAAIAAVFTIAAAIAFRVAKPVLASLVPPRHRHLRRSPAHRMRRRDDERGHPLHAVRSNRSSPNGKVATAVAEYSPNEASSSSR